MVLITTLMTHEPDQANENSSSPHRQELVDDTLHDLTLLTSTLPRVRQFAQMLRDRSSGYGEACQCPHDLSGRTRITTILAIAVRDQERLNLCPPFPKCSGRTDEVELSKLSTLMPSMPFTSEEDLCTAPLHASYDTSRQERTTPGSSPTGYTVCLNHDNHASPPFMSFRTLCRPPDEVRTKRNDMVSVDVDRPPALLYQ